MTNSPTIPVSKCVGTLVVVAVGTATSCVTSKVEKTVTGHLALTTDSESASKVHLVVVGATTKLVAFVAERAEEGFIEFVHSHSLTRTTDTIQEFGKHFFKS